MAKRAAPLPTPKVQARPMKRRNSPAQKEADLRVVLVTAPEKDAERIARILLEERMIACANLLPGVISLFWWEGKINREGETLMLLKTPRSKISILLKRVKELHGYAVPEFLALPIREANPDYLKWAENATR